MSNTIPVVIQTPETQAPFTDWPLDQLDKVIPLLERWGIVDKDGESLDTSTAMGDFVVVGQRFVFRVSVGLD